jgi:hypothetical protein
MEPSIEGGTLLAGGLPWSDHDDKSPEDDTIPNGSAREGEMIGGPLTGSIGADKADIPNENAAALDAGTPAAIVLSKLAAP